MRPSRTGLHAYTAIAIAAAVATTAAGQGGHVVVTEDVEGGERHMSYFSLPDIPGLFEPAYRRSDLPVFNEKLALDEAQRLLVAELLERYLEQFATLRDGMKLAMQDGPVQIRLGSGGLTPITMRLGGGGADGVDELVGEALREMGGDGDATGERGEVSVMITVSGSDTPPPPPPAGEGEDAGGGVVITAGGGEPGDEEPQVMLALSGPAAEELSEEARAKLEASAKQIVEQLREQMQAGAGAVAAGGMPSFPSPEEHRAAMTLLREKAEELEKRKAQLGRTFETDVQAQLTDEQLRLWPALERALTRIKTLPKGRLDGERTDVLSLIEELELAEAELDAVAETVEAFELALHQVLVARNAELTDADRKVDKAVAEGRYDRALSLLDRVANLRVAVRRINEQFAASVARELPAEPGALLETRFNEVSFPSVYRPTHADRLFETAVGLDGLDEQARDGLETLQEAYRLERERIDQEIVKAIRRHQPEEPKRPIERMRRASFDETSGLTPFHDDPTAVEEAFERRRELDRKYASLIESLLTPEQRERLPKPAKRGPIIIGG